MLSMWQQLPAVLSDKSPAPQPVRLSAEFERTHRLATAEVYTKTLSWRADCRAVSTRHDAVLLVRLRAGHTPPPLLAFQPHYRAKLVIKA